MCFEQRAKMKPILTELEAINQINQDKKSKQAKPKGFGHLASAGSEAGTKPPIKITDVLKGIDALQTSGDTPVVSAAVDAVTVDPPAAPTAPQFDISQLQTLINTAVNGAIAPLSESLQAVKTELDAANAAIAEKDAVLASKDAALTETQAKLAESQKAESILESLSKLTGSPTTQRPDVPMVNTKTSINGEPQGLAREFVELLNDRDRLQIRYDVMGYSSTTGQMVATHRHGQKIKEFIWNSFNEERRVAQNWTWRNSELIKTTEAWFKANGLLSGNVRNISGRSTNAAGASTGAPGLAPDLFLDVLSAMMRETHNYANIFWQFTTTVFDPTSEPGKNILVPRANYLARPTSVSDFVIANTTTFNAINLTTGSSSDAQGIEVTTVPIACTQYGIGRGGSTGTRPIFIPEFHQQVALVNLMDLADSRLMQNYYAFEELILRSQFELSTNVIYNNNNLVETTPGNITTGGGATLTKEYLSAVYSYMFAAQVPSLTNGHYILAVNPTAKTQLEISLQELYRPVTPEQMMEITNVMKSSTGVEIGRSSGYIGSYCGFEIFVGNSFGVGAAGASPTVNNVAFNAAVGTKLTMDSFAFGVGAVGRGVALPMEIRTQGSPFDLGTAFIWVSREGAAPLDLDATLGSPTDPESSQQTRCYRLRTAAAPV
jgi:hypothetical protein